MGTLFLGILGGYPSPSPMLIYFEQCPIPLNDLVPLDMHLYIAVRVGTMPDRSDQIRKAAADCVAIAAPRPILRPGSACSPLAQKWYDLANGSAINFVREFTDRQMSDIPKPAMQQQRQIQPRKKRYAGSP
jgi:hypothetical protein